MVHGGAGPILHRCAWNLATMREAVVCHDLRCDLQGRNCKKNPGRVPGSPARPGAGVAAGVRPWRRMTSAIFARSGPGHSAPDHHGAQRGRARRPARAAHGGAAESGSGRGSPRPARRARRDEQTGHEPAPAEPRRSRLSRPVRRARRGPPARCSRSNVTAGWLNSDTVKPTVCRNEDGAVTRTRRSHPASPSARGRAPGGRGPDGQCPTLM